MRLRRLEIIIIGITLAFAFFMGGFFTGRNWNAINITTVAAQNEKTHETVNINHSRESSAGHEPGSTVNTAPVPPAGVNTQAPAEVPEQPVQQEATGEPRGGDGRININLASQSELTDLPGIGSVLASRIVDYRRQHGDFQRIEDIRNVSGIGEKRFEAIQDKITVTPNS